MEVVYCIELPLRPRKRFPEASFSEPAATCRSYVFAVLRAPAYTDNESLEPDTVMLLCVIGVETPAPADTVPPAPVMTSSEKNTSIMLAVASNDMPFATGAVVSADSAKHVNDFEIAARELPARSLMTPVGIDTVNCIPFTNTAGMGIFVAFVPGEMPTASLVRLTFPTSILLEFLMLMTPDALNCTGSEKYIMIALPEVAETSVAPFLGNMETKVGATVSSVALHAVAALQSGVSRGEHFCSIRIDRWGHA